MNSLRSSILIMWIKQQIYMYTIEINSTYKYISGLVPLSLIGIDTMNQLNHLYWYRYTIHWFSSINVDPLCMYGCQLVTSSRMNDITQPPIHTISRICIWVLETSRYTALYSNIYIKTEEISMCMYNTVLISFRYDSLSNT